MTDHEKTIRTALESARDTCQLVSAAEQIAAIDAALASLTALQEERERESARMDLHVVRDGRIAGVVTSLKDLRSAMDATYAEAHESLFRTWSLQVGCAIVALQTPEMRAAMESAPQEAAVSRMCQECGHPNHKSRMHQDVCTFYVQALGAECGCTAPQEGRS